MQEHEAFEHEVDDMGRYDISSTGSLSDALNDLQMAMCAEPEVADDSPAGRWAVDDVTVEDAPIARAPEARTPRRSSPGLEPRARRQPEPQIPSVLDRIATMPRVRTTSGIAHPTGEAWVAPTQRQFCGRPPV